MHPKPSDDSSRTSVQHRDTEFLRTGSPRPRIVLRGSQRILTLLTTGSEAMLIPRSSVDEHLNSLVGSWVLIEWGGDGWVEGLFIPTARSDIPRE